MYGHAKTNELDYRKNAFWFCYHKPCFSRVVMHLFFHCWQVFLARLTISNTYLTSIMHAFWNLYLLLKTSCLLEIIWLQNFLMCLKNLEYGTCKCNLTCDDTDHKYIDDRVKFLSLITSNHMIVPNCPSNQQQPCGTRTLSHGVVPSCNTQSIHKNILIHSQISQTPNLSRSIVVHGLQCHWLCLFLLCPLFSPSSTLSCP